jgi:hypothetical protein
LANFAAVAMEIKKGGLNFFFLFLSSNFMKHRRNVHRSVWKLLACWENSKWRYHGNRGTKVMVWGEVRYFFAMAILVTSPRLLSGDVLLLHHPYCCRVMYCYSTFLFHYSYYYYYYSYYYYSSTHFCPLDISEMPWSNFMKPCRNIICHVKLCS